jgi:uncharacterized protein
VNRIVCNTGPLIALGLLDQLKVLEALFDEILVPEEVHREIETGGVSRLGLESFRKADWIRILPCRLEHDTLLDSLLHEGEASVILLAREQGVRTVLIDERKARKVARDIYGLQVIGTARVLVEAKRRGLVPDVASALRSLREEGYWIHELVVRAALKEAGESTEG